MHSIEPEEPRISPEDKAKKRHMRVAARYQKDRGKSSKNLGHRHSQDGRGEK